MRASEFAGKPHLYLDQDGVQADFFTAWAQWHNKKFGQSHVERYKDIGSREQREQSISELNTEGPEFIAKFFATLPVLPGFARLLKWIIDNRIPFTVLSAPLRNNEEASIQGKRAWLARHNPQGATNPIFTSDKAKLATQGGQPNVLVDDFKKYVQAWRDAGGIAVLHRDNNVEETIRQLEKIYGVGQEVTEARGQALRNYAVKVQLKQPGYKNIIDTTVVARNPEMARRLVRQQYGDRNVMVGQPRELK
jgi:hypothetical protein